MITVGMASIPARERLLYFALDSLLWQVDRIGVYLNGYEQIPGFCINDKITVITSQEFGDRGDAGKFFWADEVEDYYLTCDDDLRYQAGYVDLILQGIERWGRQAVVSIHGSVFDPGAQRTLDRTVYPCLGSLDEDLPVHMLGTGVMGYHSDTWRISRDIFKIKNMADLWLAAHAQHTETPMMVLAHPWGVVEDLDPQVTIWDESFAQTGSKMDTSYEQAALVSSISWKLNPPPLFQAQQVELHRT